MDKQPAQSFISPVYKAENYLCHCVDSLLAQTFPDFEILLIDDGSPDHSGDICDEYARKDSRVRVFHKENEGVSSTRQCGIDNAKGEYTIHADPDDWVEPDMLEELYKKAKEEDADVVICDFYEDIGDKRKYIRQQPSALDHKTVLRELFQQLHGSCCNKLVKRACYSKYDVNFPEGLSYGEDTYVSVCLLAHPIKMAYVPKAFYHYVQNVNYSSLTRRPVKILVEQCEKLCDLLRCKLSENQFKEIYPALRYRQACVILTSAGENPYIVTFKKDFEGVRKAILHQNFSFKRKTLFWIAFYISPYIARFFYTFCR